MLELALIGKPNSGKSSFFKAATMIDVKISNIPFTTIKPNEGVGYVIVDCVDREFNVKCEPNHGKCKEGKRFVPVKLWDVAGLVPDAHLGKGMGTAFLDDVRQAAALIHTVDATGETDAEGKPTTGYDPAMDIEFLEKEIDFWFADIIERALKKFERELSKAGKADMIEILSMQLTGLQVERADVERALERLEQLGMELDLKNKDSIIAFATELRRLAKPIIIAANKIDLSTAQENFEKLKEKYENKVHIVPTSAEAEIALKRADEKGFIDYLPGNSFTTNVENSNLDEQQRKALEFIKMRILAKYGSTGVQQCLNKAVFELLGNIVVYPVADRSRLADNEGHVLPDALIVPRGTTVRELAFKVHTDIGNKFICGVDARTKRKLAADYELKDGDVIEIMTAK